MKKRTTTVSDLLVCSTLIYLAQTRSPDDDRYSRRHAVRGDYDYTLAPPPAQPLLQMHALGRAVRAVRAARCGFIGVLYESCLSSELWE
jgi:hypothetical protein